MTQPKTKLNDEQKKEWFVKSLEHFIRFTAIANGGGGIATISVISATANEGVIINILALPLGLFLLGVLSCILGSLMAFFAASKIAKGASLSVDKGFEWVEPLFSRYGDAILMAPAGFFSLGCLSGVLIIAYA